MNTHARVPDGATSGGPDTSGSQRHTKDTGISVLIFSLPEGQDLGRTSERSCIVIIFLISAWVLGEGIRWAEARGETEAHRPPANKGNWQMAIERVTTSPAAFLPPREP